MKVVNSSQGVGFTKCRIIPAIYWITHVVVFFTFSIMATNSDHHLMDHIKSSRQLARGKYHARNGCRDNLVLMKGINAKKLVQTFP